MAAAPDGQPPLLRVHWPRRLAVPSDRTGGVLLLGQRRDGNPGELVVAAAATGGSGAADGLEPVAALLEHPDDCRHSWANLPAFILQPVKATGGALPLLVAGMAPSAAAGPRTRRSTARQHSQEACDCQVILYGRGTPLPLHGSITGSRSSSGAAGTAPPTVAGQRCLAARLAPHLLGALLACLLLARSQQLAVGAAAAYASLAGFAARQLAWLMTAQPAGVKLHRQLCELLAVGGLQYVAAAQAALAGRGPALAGAALALLAAAFVARGPQRALAALRCLLWAAELPVSLPYAAMAALYRWQLCSTAVMWRVMRGRQRLPLLRERATAWLRRRRLGGGGERPAAPPEPAPASPRAPLPRKFGFSSGGGSGLKQLSGSMLLFMPLLLLLPTTAAFYALALALHAACSLPRAAALLAAQLAAHNPAAAAARALAGAPAQGGGDALQYRPVPVLFDERALANSEALQAAAARTVYLEAQQRHGSPWRAALQAAGRAWVACAWAAPLPTALAVVAGCPLWLAAPDWASV